MVGGDLLVEPEAARHFGLLLVVCHFAGVVLRRLRLRLVGLPTLGSVGSVALVLVRCLQICCNGELCCPRGHYWRGCCTAKLLLLAF